MLPHHTGFGKYFFILLLVVIALYAYSTAQNFLYGPQIIIDVPAEGISVQSELIEISGTVQNVSILRLEGRIIPITEEGLFTETMLVTPGINKFLFEAEDTFGRTRTESVHIVYNPPTRTPTIPTPAATSTSETSLIE